MMSPGSLILIAVIVALLFGTKRIRNLGEDMATAIKGFRKGLSGEELPSSDTDKSKTNKE